MLYTLKDVCSFLKAIYEELRKIRKLMEKREKEGTR